MHKKPSLFVVNRVDPSMIREESFQGEPHYMISSSTMPDDIVMNGGLYPKDEIEATYNGLEGVHAPLGHPQNNDGDFISAAEPFAVRHYGVGAQVVNVRRENGRILHDIAINIAECKLRGHRGQRLLDRVGAMINGDNTQPIHTSTGVYLKRTTLPQPMTNQYGEYDWVASDLQYDHNAILLDEVGASTPEQGTGMGINHEFDGVPVFALNFDSPASDIDSGKIVSVSGDDMYNEIHELEKSIREAIKVKFASGDNEYVWVCELHEGYVIAEISKNGEEDSYKIPYMIDGELISVGELQKVKRSVVYSAVNSLKRFIKSMGFAPSIDAPYNDGVNNQSEDLEMALTTEEKAALVADISKEVTANLSQPIADAVASAVKPVADRMDTLETNAKSAEQAEKSVLAEKLGLEADEAEGMSVNAMKKLADKLDAQQTGEYGERFGSLDANNSQKQKDEWEGYDINANLEDK